jgi:hypothetical protein
MQADPPPWIEMCANRFELVTQWGQPVDKVWAMGMFKAWLDGRIDSAPPHVYDGGIPQKGDEHVQPLE